MNAQKLALFVGALRLGIGSALVVAPKFAGGVWIGENDGGQGAGAEDHVARADGPREHVDALAAVVLPDPDAADAVATLLAFKTLSKGRALAMPVIAGAVAAAGYVAAKELD